MSHVLVSYRRDDEARIARLVLALEKAGLDVWWDQKLPGGEAWRENIEAAIDQAGCVVVAWTHSSVGPQGGFVREEATRASARGILVPVRLDPVAPPLGFGEIQAIDLTRWRGGLRDAHFQDLIEACKAKIERRDVKAAKGPARRLLRRAATGSALAAAVATAGSLSFNVFKVQDHICTLPVDQPQVSDMCGALHLGGRPSFAERTAWADRPPGDCAALRTLIARFPDGAYRGKAADLLAGAVTVRAADFTPAPRTARGYVRQSEHGLPTVAAAQADARTRAQADAEQVTCAPADAFERLGGADIGAITYDCRPSPVGGQACGADYVATCRLQARALTERCG